MTIETSTPIVFATAPTGSSAPDSITIGGGSIWVEYGNGSSSTGGVTDGVPANSTIVQYSMTGQVEHTYADTNGLADGLKYDPVTGTVWVLNNNDDNSNLQFINPTTQTMSAPLTYGPPYMPGAGRGFDDVVFDGNRIFLSETNPAVIGDPVIVQLVNPFSTLQTTPILSFGDTGTDLNTGQKNQPLPITDPDSLKLLPNGDLLLTGEADGAYIFVKNPGTTHQTESFVTLPLGDVPDDAIMPTSSSGTFYISNQSGNNIISVQVTGLNTKDLYADITAGPNANELVQIDPKTGAVTPVVTGLDNPHGLAFVPSSPKALVAGDPPTSSLGTNNALTTTGVQNTNENTTDGTPTTSTTHNGISSTADTFVFPPNLGEHNNVVTVTDQIQPPHSDMPSLSELLAAVSVDVHHNGQDIGVAHDASGFDQVLASHLHTVQNVHLV